MNTDVAAQKALDRLTKAGFHGLTATEKILAAVWMFEAGVANHGFRRYFTSAAGDLAVHAPAALRVIGAAGKAEIATAANAVFGPDGPPADRQERRARLRALGTGPGEIFRELETRFYELPEDVDELLEAYLNCKGQG